jgi:hypothetical protein
MHHAVAQRQPPTHKSCGRPLSDIDECTIDKNIVEPEVIVISGSRTPTNEKGVESEDDARKISKPRSALYPVIT